jgi:hypothetical protein
MALLPYPDLDELEPEARKVIDQFTAEHGRPTPLYSLMGHFPPLLTVAASAYISLMTKGKLGRRFKELLFVATSQVRDCFY